MATIAGGAPIAADGDEDAPPTPVLNKGVEVPVSNAWQVVEGRPTEQASLAPAEGGWTRVMLERGKAVEIETKLGSGIKPLHVYRVEVPIRGPVTSSLNHVGLKMTGEPGDILNIWPPRFAVSAGGLAPVGFRLRGYVIVPPDVGAGTALRATIDGPSGGNPLAELGPPRLVDLETVTEREPETWYQCGFEKWTTEGNPQECLAVIFAKPGQFVPTKEAVHSGQSAGLNPQGRVWLWGMHVPCRFGTLLRVRVWARGQGSVVLGAIPFLGATGRGLPPREARFEVDGDEWQSFETILGQNQPEADTVIPTLDINGNVCVDDFTVERIGSLRRR